MFCSQISLKKMLPIVDRLRRNLQNRNVRLERTLLRVRADPFSLPENRFIELFRLNKQLAHELCEILSPHLPHTRYSTAISVEAKVLTAIRFFASGCYQRSIGEDYNLGLSQTSVHRCIHEVAVAIDVNLSGNGIKFPTDRIEVNQNKELFMNRFGFPGVVGAIDCTHVAILKPRQEEHNFINRKGYHSLNCQIICDAQLKILNINANYGGSSHDSFIWRQSVIRDYILREHNNGLRRTWLIGDSGYPLEPFLMTPFHDPAEGSPEARYNRHHILARNCVERCIGVLKGRFRCLLKERSSRYSPQFMGHVINSCAVLHNICIENGLDFNENANDDVPDQNRVPNVQGNLLNAGRGIRQNIVNMYFND